MRAKEFLNEAGAGHAWGGDPKDLGHSLQKKKRYIDPTHYAEAKRKPFQTWIDQTNLTKSNINVLFDLRGREQHTTIYHTPGNPSDIWAYEMPAGSVSSSAPMRMVRKDIAPPGLLY